MAGAELQAGRAFFDLVPKLDKGAMAATEAQAGGAFSGLSSSAAKTGLAIGAGLVAGGGIVAAGLIKIGSSFDDAFDTIRLGTGATGAALEGLKDSFRTVTGNVPDDLGKVSTAIADLNTRTGLTGPALEGLATQVLNLSRISGEDLAQTIEKSTRLFGDWGVAVEDQAPALDKIWKASQATGIGVNELQEKLVKFGGPLRQLGFSMDEAAALMGKFEKEGVNADLVLGSLRIALGKMAKSGEPAKETLARVTGEIKNAGDASTANALALELFGARAGPDMAAAIREGRFEIADLMQSIKDSPETVNGAAAATEDFAEKFARLKNRVMLVLEPLAGKFFDGLTKIAEFGERNFAPTLARITDALTKVGDVVRWVADRWNVLGPIFGAVAALIATVVIPHFVAMGVAAAISAAKTVAAWVTTQAAAIAAVAIHSAQVVAMVAGWVLMGVQSLLNAAKVAAAWLIAMGPIALVIAAVVGLVVVIVKNWDTIKNVITGAVEAVLGFLRNNWPLILAILTGPIGLAVLAIVKNWDTIKDGVTAVKDWIVARFNDIVGFVTGLPGRIAGVAAGMWDGIKNAFKGAINWIIRAWNSLEFKLPGFKVGPIGYEGFTLGVPDIPELAGGGTVTSGGLSIVGEGSRAGELVNLPRGASVIPLDVARMLATAAGSAAPAPVIGRDLVLQGAEMTPADLTAELAWYAKTSGR